MEVLATRFMSYRTISLCNKLRTPMIKFRYGISRDHNNPPAATSPVNSQAAAGINQPGQVIYDFQIPARWRRKPLSEEEIDYINRGGPDKL
ncbi:uncharacterized protein LOC123306549 [Coccinella septempunctata]|uniref:uncharacterized protein LOC123306549 n=1 Tax=Coccinella septempunctata TaxID=41139 RepID=UPI001D0865B2|nr:uncharacterized protein LOC123306549 [Coccinella septempunctata]